MAGIVYPDIENKPSIGRELEYRARDLSQAIVLAHNNEEHEKAVTEMTGFLDERWPRMTDWRNPYRCSLSQVCAFATANEDGHDACPLHSALMLY